MNAVIIARVSTEEQKEQGNSLPAQITRLKSYCTRKNYKIIKQFSFDESAYKNKRNDFDEIINYILDQKEVVAVCFDKVDRLSRNVFDTRVAALYEKALRDEVELHFPSDGQVINSQISAVEKFQFGISLGLAKYFSDAISDNVKRAREQMLRDGIWPAKAPYGYTNTTKENGDKWIEVKPVEAEVISTIFNLYASEGYSMQEVKDEVNTRFNKDFAKSRIAHILDNPFYTGTMRTNSKEYPHYYDRIISPDTFGKVQDVKQGHNKKKFKYAGLSYAYRGLLTCKECGCTITPEKKLKKLKDGSTNKHVYYHCTEYHGKHGAQWLTENELTKQFASIYDQIMVPEEVADKIVTTLKDSHQQKNQHHKTLLTSYESELSKYQNRIERMYEDYLDKSITKDFYAKKQKEYRDKQNEITAKISRLQTIDEDYYLASEYILKLANKAGKLLKRSEQKEKRILINMTLQNLTLDGKKVRYEWKKPFDKIAFYAHRQAWLEKWYEFGKIDWVSELEYPEWTVKEVGRFLVLTN